jgi:hypothetical protein
LREHVLVANLVHAGDDRWSSLYAALAYQQARTAGFVYQAALRAGLVAELGVTFGPVTNGAAEIAGMPKDLLKEFSTRRTEIEARLQELGGTSRRTRELAALETRRAKELGSSDSPESLRHGWRRRSLGAGIEPHVLESVLGLPREPTIGAAEQESITRELLGDKGLTCNVSAFERRDAVRGVAERLPEGAHLDAIEHLTDWVLGNDEVVLLDKEGRAGEQLRTTKELLRIESDLIASGEEMRSRGRRVPDDIVEAVLAERPGMADEQAEMVRRLTTSGDGLQIVIGKAGAGKTYGLDAARAAWQRAGFSVQGTALSARAAAELESGAGISSCTLAKFTAMSNLSSIASRDVIVVDEAGLVGTRALQRLVLFAKLARASVVLVGDPRQLPAIEAGGALQVLARQLGPIELSENRRQTEGWERQALDELRHGKVAVGVVAYEEHGRLHMCDSARSARLAMVSDWASWRDEPGSSRMYAISRTDVEDLNLLAREALRQVGRLGPDVLLAGSRGYAIGDEVMFLRNDRELGVLNGTRGTVTEASDDGLVVDSDRGRRSVGLDYIEEGNLGHSYASTIHKSQGATVDRAFVLGGDALYREAGYVAMTRARLRTELYVIASAFDDGLAPDASSPGLVRALSTSKAKHLAVESINPERADEQAVELAWLRRRLDDERPPDPTRDRRALESDRRYLADTSFQHDHGAGQRLAAKERRVLVMEAMAVRFAATHAPEIERAAELETAARMREHLLGEVAAQRPLPHLLEVIGEVPQLPRTRSMWMRAAGALETFRQRSGERDAGSALSREPATTELRREQEALWELIGAVDPAYHRTADRGWSRGLSL